MRSLAILAVAALAGLAPSAAAGCDTLQTAPFVLVPLDTPEGTFYVYFDGGCDPTCHGAEWFVFEETNGVPGLQYNDFFGHPHEDRCGGATQDTIVL